MKGMTLRIFHSSWALNKLAPLRAPRLILLRSKANTRPRKQEFIESQVCRHDLPLIVKIIIGSRHQNGGWDALRYFSRKGQMKHASELEIKYKYGFNINANEIP